MRIFIVPSSFPSTRQQAIPLFRNLPSIIRSTTVFLLDKGPVQVGDREAGFWASPPRRSWTDKVFERVGTDGYTERTLTSVHTPNGVQIRPERCLAR